MANQLLIEYLDPEQASLSSTIVDPKSIYLVGRMMTGDQRNLNNRIYPAKELSNSVSFIVENAKTKNFIMGEVNHPKTLSIDLKNVSHCIVEAWMDGSNAIGKCKLLNTPSGNIIKGLIEGGIRPGVSSRGTGEVNESGYVSNFQFVTLDIVAQPSGPGCYPDIIRESVENQKIISLAEAVVDDPAAQKYFKAEINKFINSILGK